MPYGGATTRGLSGARDIVVTNSSKEVKLRPCGLSVDRTVNPDPDIVSAFDSNPCITFDSDSGFDLDSGSI
ncbi:hypothetical protein EVAR_99104_1 [Eumeta japonica]|uniref:Uncharacterized protein n=1 Tax=Eumeta variegata TaxID=151549 RepID=A0A4C1Z5G8_EUMVA|nr:hypothetical protein EVAR_99104_1 [Eumeta japonica]